MSTINQFNHDLNNLKSRVLKYELIKCKSKHRLRFDFLNLERVSKLIFKY